MYNVTGENKNTPTRLMCVFNETRLYQNPSDTFVIKNRFPYFQKVILDTFYYKINWMFIAN